MKWLTWNNVGVDRMACAWLILHFIDPEATFAFIPHGQKTPPDGAEPFDIPGVRYSHHRGRSTFHTLVQEFDLKDPALDWIARIVDEADTIQAVTLEPAAPGLDLLCRGLRLISPDDRVAFERGGLIYDALYAAVTAEQTRTRGK